MANGTGYNFGFEEHLWTAADKLHGILNFILQITNGFFVNVGESGI